jgi:hypothetical protein
MKIFDQKNEIQTETPWLEIASEFPNLIRNPDQTRNLK